MTAYTTQKNLIGLIAALLMAAVLTAAPHAQAADPVRGQAAHEQGLLHIEFEQMEPQNPAQLRRLLSSQKLSADQRLDLERALDGLYEELG